MLQKYIKVVTQKVATFALLKKNYMPYKITNNTDIINIDIFGDIDSWFGNNLKSFSDELNTHPANLPLRVRISSYGGDVLEALGIANLIATQDRHVTTIGLGIVASAATLILLAGDTRKMAKNSFFMIHSPSSEAYGGSENMRKTADVLDNIENNLISIYTDALTTAGKLSGDVRATVTDWVHSETWFNADDAFKYGFIDEIILPVEYVTPTNAKLLHAKFAAFKNTPLTIQNTISEMENQSILDKIKALFMAEATPEPETEPVTNDVTEAEKAAMIEAAITLLEGEGYTVTAPEPMPAPAAAETTTVVENSEVAVLRAELEKIKAQIATPPKSLINEPVTDAKKQPTMHKEEAAMWANLTKSIISKNNY